MNNSADPEERQVKDQARVLVELIKLAPVMANTCGGTLLAGLSLYIVHSWCLYIFPAAIVVWMLTVILALRQKWSRRVALAGSLAGLLLLVPLLVVLTLFEGGLFDDGPFVGSKYTMPVTGEPSFAMKISGSEKNLQIVNRKGQAPLMLCRDEHDNVDWAVEMNTTEMPGTEFGEITSAQLECGLLRCRVDFVGVWTYGAERGTSFFWRFGGFQKFYLSW